MLIAVNFAPRRLTCSVSGSVREGMLFFSTHKPIQDRRTWQSDRLDFPLDEGPIVLMA